MDQEKTLMLNSLNKLVIIFQRELLQVFQDELGETPFSVNLGNLDVLTTWTEGRLAVGGLLGEIKQLFFSPNITTTINLKIQGQLLFLSPLVHASGEGEDNIGSHFLTGCLEKIQVQGKDLDLDLAVKHMSISPHSCPT